MPDSKSAKCTKADIRWASSEMDLQQRCAFHEAGHAVAALAFAIPILAVTIDDDRPHLHRARYHAPDADLGLECMVTLCLCGPAAEELFCGPITDGSDQTDYEMARQYLARCVSNPLHAAAELARYRDAAQRLVRPAWARQRIAVLADALLRHGSLSSDEVLGLASNRIVTPDRTGARYRGGAKAGAE
jgi:hypothetical protein